MKIINFIKAIIASVCLIAINAKSNSKKKYYQLPQHVESQYGGTDIQNRGLNLSYNPLPSLYTTGPREITNGKKFRKDHNNYSIHTYDSSKKRLLK